MSWRYRLAVLSLLVIAAASDATLLVLAAFAVPPNPAHRGLVLGVLAGLGGASMLFAGLVVGSARSAARSGPPPARKGKPAVSPEEAKFWLQRFLLEHQARAKD